MFISLALFPRSVKSQHGERVGDKLAQTVNESVREERTDERLVKMLAHGGDHAPGQKEAPGTMPSVT